jgi:hypothetical protein
MLDGGEQGVSPLPEDASLNRLAHGRGLGLLGGLKLVQALDEQQDF